MKTMKMIGLVFFAMCLSVNFSVQAQETEEAPFEPLFLTVVTTKWNTDPDVDFSDWEAVEKEYHEKVTMKNELILGSGFYMHYFTPKDNEIKLVTVYKTWEDIEGVNDVINKLIEEGWPNEEERDAFFKKRNSYYSTWHSDEIYVTTPYSKPMDLNTEKPLIFYVQMHYRGDGGKGYKEYFDNITMKNPYLKAFYTHVHRWGSNSNEVAEVRVYESLADMEKGNEEVNKLIEAHWPDEEERTKFFEEYDKMFKGHGDYFYRHVPFLVK